MKRIFTASLALLLVLSNAHAISFPAAPKTEDPKPVAPPAVERFVNLTPKEYQELTGQKLNFIQKLKLKASQKLVAKGMAEGKSQLTAALLAFFLGGLGIHRFYLGYTWQGVVQLLTLGGLGIWALIDFIRILTGSLKPKDGEYAKTL